MKKIITTLVLTILFSAGASMMSAQQTGNDCMNAIMINEGIFTNVSISDDGVISNICFGDSGDHSIWYQYTPTESGTVAISSSIDPEMPDTRLSVYSGDCSALVCVAFDDDGGEGFTSLAYLDVTQGDPLYIEWDDRWSDESFDFVVNYEGETVIPGCTDSEASNYNELATYDDGSCIFPLNCENNEVLIQLEGGNFFGEMSWTITDENGELYEEGGYYNPMGSSDFVFCIDDGCYSFNMFDSFGDGWGGSNALISVNGEVVAEASLNGGVAGNITFGVNMEECEDIVLEVLGCVDPEALNFNEYATTDDGSCVYPFTCDEGVIGQLQIFCPVFTASSIEVVGSDGSVLVDVIMSEPTGQDFFVFDLCLLPEVCYTVSVTNLDYPEFNDIFGFIMVDGNQVGMFELSEIENATLDFSMDGTCGPLLGCTNPLADNYNPEAEYDNGTCEFTIENDHCNDAQPLVSGETILINNQGADSEGLYGSCWGFGSGDEEQNGIWFSFTTPADPAVIVIEASGDGSYTFTDTQFGVFENCGDEEMIACDGNSGDGLYSRLLFECGDLEPNTEYLLLVDGWAGDQGTCLLSYNVADGCAEVYGCMDDEALNYNAEATFDDGSCEYPLDCENGVLQVQFELGSWVNEVSWYIQSVDGSSDDAEGTANEGELQQFCFSDGCYELFMFDSFGDGWNGNIITITDGATGDVLLTTTLEEGSEGSVLFGFNSECENVVYGCTDPEALNFDQEATIDDGSCEYEGCPNTVSLSIFGEGIEGWLISELVGGEEILYQQGETIEQLICLEDGCYTLCLFGDLDPINDVFMFDIGTGETIAFVSADFENSCYTFSINDDCFDGEQILGCTDPSALNYNPLATIDDGSCLYLPIDTLSCVASFEIINIDEEEDVIYILNTSSFGWGYEYLWDFGDGSTSTAPLPIHEYAEDGTYDICLTISGPNECEDVYCMEITYVGGLPEGPDGTLEGGFSINVVDDVDVVNGVEEYSIINGLQLYPNPATSEMNVEYNLEKSTQVVFNVYDVTGAQLRSVVVGQNIGFNKLTLNVNDLASGLYLLEIQMDGDTKNVRFQVSK